MFSKSMPYFQRNLLDTYSLDAPMTMPAYTRAKMATCIACSWLIEITGAINLKEIPFADCQIYIDSHFIAFVYMCVCGKQHVH